MHLGGQVTEHRHRALDGVASCTLVFTHCRGCHSWGQKRLNQAQEKRCSQKTKSTWVARLSVTVTQFYRMFFFTKDKEHTPNKTTVRRPSEQLGSPRPGRQLRWESCSRVPSAIHPGQG